MFRPGNLGHLGRLGLVAAMRNAFSPLSLFAAGEPGAWYDPSDLSTLFQDSAGTVPVTAVEQPVGLILDKSKGLILGPQLVANGDFSSGTTGWTATTGTISAPAGKLIIANEASGANVAWANATVIPTVVGRTYRLTFDFEKGTANQGAVVVGSTPRGADLVTFGATNMTATGSKSAVFVATTAQAYVTALNNTTMPSGTSTFDNIFVRELLGNHAIQATTTKRPVYSRRVNLLTKTEQFSDAAWFKGGYGGGLPPTVIANDASGPASDGFADKVTFFSAGAGAQSLLFATAAFSPIAYRGVLCLKAASPGDVGKIIALRHAASSAYLLITLTADYQVISRNETALAAVGGSLDIALRPDVGTSSGEVSIHLAYASLTLAADAHLPYQRVNTDTDYDAAPAKFPAYLRFDGVDDALQTGNINFTGTDKMTVWAGVTKLSDAATNTVVELSASKNANNGVFALFAPLTGGSPDISWYSKGTNERLAGSTSESAPVTRVITGIGDISGDISSIRLNGAIVNTETADQGSGNFGNYPLYIGARANTSLYFNGRIYSLIVRGAQSTLSQIEATELYMKKKVGIA